MPDQNPLLEVKRADHTITYDRIISTDKFTQSLDNKSTRVMASIQMDNGLKKVSRTSCRDLN